MAKSEGTIPDMSLRTLAQLQATMASPYTPRSVKEACLTEIREIEARLGTRPERYNSGRFSRSVSELARMEEEDVRD